MSTIETDWKLDILAALDLLTPDMNWLDIMLLLGRVLDDEGINAKGQAMSEGEVYFPARLDIIEAMTDAERDAVRNRILSKS